MSTPDHIALRGVRKRYGPVEVIPGLDLGIAEGEFVTFLGPSGSGKTTILMMLAGFEAPSAGEILVAGRPISRLPPHRRDIGMVFQSYALFPHMTVAENIAYPLRARGMGHAARDAKVRASLDLIRLEGIADRRPAQLSGGQQQRVALARALVFDPRLVLLDEPLGALDKQLREEMQLELRRLHRELGATFIFVTHDQGEALTMSDRVAVFRAGRLEQISAPEAIYDHPASRFVAGFMGETNFLAAELLGREGESCTLRLGDGTPLRGTATPATPAPGPGPASASVSVRPERLSLAPRPGDNRLRLTLADVVYHGDHLRLYGTGPAGAAITLKLARTQGGMPAGNLAPGTAIEVGFAPEDALVLDPP